MGIGLVIVVCAVLVVYQYFAVDAPQRDRFRAMDTEMMRIDTWVKGYGGVLWEPRRYWGWGESQAWLVPMSAVFDDLEKNIDKSMHVRVWAGEIVRGELPGGRAAQYRIIRVEFFR